MELSHMVEIASRNPISLIVQEEKYKNKCTIEKRVGALD